MDKISIKISLRNLAYLLTMFRVMKNVYDYDLVINSEKEAIHYINLRSILTRTITTLTRYNHKESTHKIRFNFGINEVYTISFIMENYNLPFDRSFRIMILDILTKVRLKLVQDLVIKKEPMDAVGLITTKQNHDISQ